MNSNNLRPRTVKTTRSKSDTDRTPINLCGIPKTTQPFNDDADEC